MIFFMDDGDSLEAQWDPDGGRCSALVQSLASIHFQAMGERAEGEEPLLSQGHGLGPTARSTRVRPGHGKNDNITAVQEGQGAAGVAGGVTNVARRQYGRFSSWQGVYTTGRI